jgi:flagellar hook-length control protein FliK
VINQTALSTTTSEVQSSKPSRKSSVEELGDFLGMLNLQTEQSTSQLYTYLGSSNADSATESSAQSADTNEASIEKNTSVDSRSNRSQENDTQNSTASDTSDADNDSTASSQSSADSDTSTTDQAAQGVDGEESSSTDASTEVAVDAQSISDNKASSSTSKEFKELIQALAGESNSDAVDSFKLTAKTIDRNNATLQTNLNLTNQQFVFETGLAEHFVRLMTDQYDQLKSSTSQTDTGSGTATSTTPTAALTAFTAGQTSTGNTQSLLNMTSTSTSTSSSSQTTGNEATENISKIMQIVRSNLGRRQSQLTVQLDPPELGKMRVDVKVIDNNLQLAITTETAEAKQVLSSRMETLRSNLEQSGITLSKFEVVSQADNASANQNDQQFQNQSQNGNGNSSFFQHPQFASNSGQADSTDQTTIDNQTDLNVTLTNTNSSNTTLNLVA